MEKQLLLKLLNYSFFLEHKGKLIKGFFEKELELLYKTIERAHEEYKTDLTLDWVNQLFKQYYPAIPTSAKKNIANLLDDLKHEDIPPDNMAEDILQDLYEKELARQIVADGLEVINGTKKIAELHTSAISLLDNVTIESLERYEEVQFDLNGLLDFTDPKNLYPFRLPGLQEKILGAGPGNFVIIFARPESGKTSFSLFETAGHIIKGRKVVYFANEEPAKRVYLRLISSTLEKTERDIRENIENCKKQFEPYAKNIRLIDCVAMDISNVDSWVAKNRPDVVFLDQLDKFSIEGKFNRDDQRLSELYAYAREIAKRYKCLVYAVCQCSADGEGLTKLDFSMLAGSKTGKAGEADLIIGIGRNKLDEEDDMYRHFTICKNKITGWHGYIGSVLDKYKVTFEA